MDDFSSLAEFERTIGEKEILGCQSSVNKPIEAGLPTEVQKDMVFKDDQVVEMSRNELGSLNGQLDKPEEMIDAVLDGISFEEGVDVRLEVVYEEENQGEGAHDSVKGEEFGLGKKADLEVGPDYLKIEQNAESIDDAIDLSQMEGVQISVIEQIEKLNSYMLKDSCNVEKNECDACDAQVSPNVQSIPTPEKTDEKVKVAVINSSQMEGASISMVEQVESLNSDMLKDSSTFEKNECYAQVSPNVQSTPLPEEIDEKVHIVVQATPATNEVRRRGRKPKAALTSKNKIPQQVSSTSNRPSCSRSKVNSEDPKPSVNLETTKRSPQQVSRISNRPLRSRSKENSKDPEPSVNLETSKRSTGRRGRKKGKENDGKPDDEFSKMRKHLRYLLHRIHYEQNLLDAYSNEGWRGQSLEKLRPEKELQRAKDDISRSKKKIRDLFQRLDIMSSEGKFPESLYDSEGLIDSEDIFCAKCGSKDLTIGNDIILCDGICERGFHQYCLDPPLVTEEIPPGDEGWLCPACDCKLDCVDLLNDSLETRLAIEDSWEKVFPEAVAAMTDKELDDIMGLPSDDSEDNEYNPDGTDDDADANANVEGNESTAESDSDESDPSEFSSASEDLGSIRGVEQNLGLLSEDSEDDDFDPDAKNDNKEGVELENSSSDFTSASEDLGVAIGDNVTSDINEPPLPLESMQDSGEFLPLTSKRSVERLDYKKLYDETYGNDASNSSEDEEWTSMVGTRKRKSSAEKAVSVSSLGASASSDGTCGSGNRRRRGRPKANAQVPNGSSAPLQESPQKKGPGGSRKRTPYNRLGEAVTQRLYQSFKENQYPDRQAKEKLANEVGLSIHRVDKWFGNARWSLHHHPSRVEAHMTQTISHSVACNGGESALADTNSDVPECGSSDISKLDVTSDRMKTVDDQSMLETSNTENLKEGNQTNPLETPEASQGKVQKKRRKSSA